MKRLQIIIVILFISQWNIQETTAQTKNTDAEKVYKTSVKSTPLEVRNSLANYSDYKISNEATYTKKSRGKIYKFKVQKNNWSHYLLIDEKGKVVGIESGEHSSS